MYDKIQVVNPNEQFSIFSPFREKRGRLLRVRLNIQLADEVRLWVLASLREHPDFHAKTLRRKEMSILKIRYTFNDKDYFSNSHLVARSDRRAISKPLKRTHSRKAETALAASANGRPRNIA